MSNAKSLIFFGSSTLLKNLQEILLEDSVRLLESILSDVNF
jgi:hypothetical protein